MAENVKPRSITIGSDPAMLQGLECDWYEGLESGLREVIRHLRNRGFNTISSCHHEPEPYIQVDCQPEDLRMLWGVLTEMRLSSAWHLKYFFDGKTGFHHAEIQFAFPALAA